MRTLSEDALPSKTGLNRRNYEDSLKNMCHHPLKSESGWLKMDDSESTGKEPGSLGKRLPWDWDASDPHPALGENPGPSDPHWPVHYGPSQPAENWPVGIDPASEGSILTRPLPFITTINSGGMCETGGERASRSDHCSSSHKGSSILNPLAALYNYSV